MAQSQCVEAKSKLARILLLLCENPQFSLIALQWRHHEEASAAREKRKRRAMEAPKATLEEIFGTGIPTLPQSAPIRVVVATFISIPDSAEYLASQLLGLKLLKTWILTKR